MKKAFAILLAICMMIPVFAVSTFAVDNSEATEIDNTIPTVYVASTGSDATTDGTNRNTPFKSFVAAYNAVIANNDTGKAKIVLLDTVSAWQENGTYPIENGAKQLRLSDFDYGNKAGTVYVCGEYDTTTQKYTGVLDLSDGTNASCLTLGANTVFYDMTFKNKAGNTNKNMWFAFAMHDVTFGFNVSKIGGACPFVGTVFNSNGVVNCDDAKDGAVFSFYSGSWGDSFLTFRNSSAGYRIAEGDNITCNIYCGTFSKLAITGESSATAAANIVTLNIYNDANITTQINNPVINDGTVNAEVNCYNGCKSKIESGMTTGFMGTFANGQNVSEKEGKLTAPSYAVNYSGVQDKSEGEKFSVRLVGTVDSLEFDYVGFEIDINGMDYSNTSKRVYTSIQGAGDTTYTAAQLGSNYIYTRTITGIPKTGTMTFTVRPFIRIGDIASGVNYYGQEYTVIYVNGVLQK